jgi:predicted small lipoprotein YifL
MRHVVLLFSVFAMILSMSAFGADGPLAPPIEIPSTPSLQPPSASVDQDRPACCERTNDEPAGKPDIRDGTFDDSAGPIAPRAGQPVESGAPGFDLAYDPTTDSIIIYLPDGSIVRRRVSELSPVRPRLPSPDTGRPRDGLDKRFTCDGGNCRLDDEVREGNGIDGWGFRPYRCPPPAYGCQGRGCCSANDDYRRDPYPRSYPPYGSYYRP